MRNFQRAVLLKKQVQYKSAVAVSKTHHLSVINLIKMTPEVPKEYRF